MKKSTEENYERMTLDEKVHASIKLLETKYRDEPFCDVRSKLKPKTVHWLLNKVKDRFEPEAVEIKRMLIF